MKTTHLRIGSIVEYNDGGGDFIETRFSKADLEIYGDHETLFIQHRPVPITPERLLKNGFKYPDRLTNGLLFNSGNYTLQLFLIKEVIVIYLTHENDGDQIMLPTIHHLHELQNLMMVLFDKEII